ncbi:MAG: adenosylcobinamide-GDP ribazoletransferase [Devosiaceae bacterium]|nr:adenosylcobinamide-GDP ribazoletransferase [Devosiaceae bacterium MH13]
MSAFFDFWRGLRFSTRLPLPEHPREAADPIVSADGFARVFPLVGVLVGALGALALLTLSALGAHPLLAATLTVTVLIIMTGALHEDGLADLADGIGGGRTRERKLEIMRDPTIGSYGTLALILGVGIRVSCLAALLETSPTVAAAALCAIAGLSRGGAMFVAAWLPLARPDGASAALGRPRLPAALTGSALALLAAVGCFFLAADVPTALAMVAQSIGAVAVSGWLTGALAQKHLGGQTGDVLGACQQICEIAALTALALFIGATN